MTMMLPARGRTSRTSCLTCDRTGGAVVADDQRCGYCLTGLSVGGRPVHPVETAPGRWVSPLSGHEVVRQVDGTWVPLPGGGVRRD